MNGYTQRVCDSILPLSVGSSLPAAFSEWRFTENTVDHGEPVETCELCGQEDLRYHFEISNELTRKTLWVGSHCILKFDVAVMEGARRLSPQEAKKHLQKLTEKMQLDACISALTTLAEAEKSAILAGALEYYRKNKKLTPKYAFVVFWKLREHDIDYHHSFFSIELKRQKHIEDLRNMPTARVHEFWSVLTPAQRKRAMDLGHKSPEQVAAEFDALLQAATIA
jgi:hypothetical protein